MPDAALAVPGPLVILLGWGMVLLVRWMSLVVEARENGIFIPYLVVYRV